MLKKIKRIKPKFNWFRKFWSKEEEDKEIEKNMKEAFQSFETMEDDEIAISAMKNFAKMCK